MEWLYAASGALSVHRHLGGHTGADYPQLIFSGVTERFPHLKCVFAEAGIGGLNYVLAACDHEWEYRHLWTEGIATRRPETLRRQMYVNFWFEAEGIKLRHHIGIDNIMWESDFPRRFLLSALLGIHRARG